MTARGEIRFEALGKSWRAIFGFAAMDAVETHYDQPMMLAMQRIFPALSPDDMLDEAKVAAAGASVRIGDLGRLFGFALMKAHPDLTREDVADIIDDIGIAEATRIVSEAARAAMAGGGDAGNGANPPRPRRKGRTG